jgi:FKBP-type peptidyl-prolyl cis-trans isomerase SlyD
MKVKKKDFVKAEYTGKIKSNNQIFDLTDEKLAKKEEIFNPKAKYGPVTICIGEGNLLKGLDNELEGKEIGKKYTIELNSESAFGPKNPKLIKVFSAKQFKKHNLNPVPGLKINMDGAIGLIRSVNSGRIIVDFNHPLSGKDIIYDIEMIEKITDKEEQVKCAVSFNLFMSENDYELKIDQKVLEIISDKEIPDVLKTHFENKIKELFSDIEAVKFSSAKKEDKK